MGSEVTPNLIAFARSGTVSSSPSVITQAGLIILFFFIYIMRLIIVRHGQTSSNANSIVTGQMHGKLTKKGRKQIKDLALQLKNKKIEVIFSSDLQRAKDTAKEIVRFHKTPIYYMREIRERNLGILEGRPREELFKVQKDSGRSTAKFRPEDGESFVDVKKRARIFLNKISKKYESKTVLIVSHSGFIKMLRSAVLKIPIEKAIEKKIENAKVYFLRF